MLVSILGTPYDRLLGRGGCSSNAVTPPGAAIGHAGVKPGHGRKVRPNGGTTIQHVVIVIQENRSFNTIFGGPKHFHGATTTSSGLEKNGTPVPLTPVSFADPYCDISHKIEDARMALNATSSDVYQMNGFDFEQLAPPGMGSCTGHADKRPYAYVNYNETLPYWFMASHYALADEFFPTELGPSFTAHVNWIASTDEVMPGEAAVDFPSTWGQELTDCTSPPGSGISYVPILLSNGQIVDPSTVYPCFWQFHTMADLLDAKGLSWRYYAPRVNGSSGGRLWSEFDAIERVRCGTDGPISKPCKNYGPDWKYVVSPAKQILKDVTNRSNPFLANVTWVVPTYTNSDHQGSDSTTGPAWVAAIVNAIGRATSGSRP